MKTSELERKLKIKNEYLGLICDFGYDYDGCNTVESLKELIDELVNFIKTIDMIFEDVEVVGLFSKEALNNAIEENKVIEIINEGETEFINSNYIMYWG